ncbi:MAG: hypothetical protein QM765_48470 [Myxococcales bacterium]
MPDRSSLEFKGVYFLKLNDTCGWDGTTGNVYSLDGELNVSPDVLKAANKLVPTYQLVVQITNNMSKDPVQTQGTVISDKTRNDFVLKEIQYSYTCRDSTANCAGFKPPQAKSEAKLGYIAAGGDGNFSLSVLTDEVAEELALWEPEGATILVGIKFKGVLASGAAIETDTLSYPIFVYSAPLNTCSTGQIPSLTTCPNMFGQDGFDSARLHRPG